jgi:HTH-type transcriptional regulator / antitoxin HigA
MLTRLIRAYLDDPSKSGADSIQEREANDWAGDFLIPPRYQSQLPELRTKAAVCEFAGALGIHPGIVVGRLQHDGLIAPSWMNDLRESFRLVAAK